MRHGDGVTEVEFQKGDEIFVDKITITRNLYSTGVMVKIKSGKYKGYKIELTPGAFNELDASVDYSKFSATNISWPYIMRYNKYEVIRYFYGPTDDLDKLEIGDTHASTGSKNVKVNDGSRYYDRLTVDYEVTVKRKEDGKGWDGKPVREYIHVGSKYTVRDKAKADAIVGEYKTTQTMKINVKKYLAEDTFVL